MQYPKLSEVIKDSDWADNVQKKEIEIGNEKWLIEVVKNDGSIFYKFVITKGHEKLIIDFGRRKAKFKLIIEEASITLNYSEEYGGSMNLEVCPENKKLRKKMMRLLLKKKDFILECPLIAAPSTAQYAFNHLNYKIKKQSLKKGYVNYIRFDNVRLVSTKGPKFEVLVDTLIVGPEYSYLTYDGEKEQKDYGEVKAFNIWGQRVFYPEDNLGFTPWYISEYPSYFKLGCHDKANMQIGFTFRVESLNGIRPKKVIFQVKEGYLEKHIAVISKNKRKKLGLER